MKQRGFEGPWRRALLTPFSEPSGSGFGMRGNRRIVKRGNHGLRSAPMRALPRDVARLYAELTLAVSGFWRK
jgi:hypothetical protein